VDHQAQFADYIFLLARTDPDAPKHAGISYLLVPMKQPGIEVRPIAQVDGSADFNEIFFTNAAARARTWWAVRTTVEGGHDHLGFERALRPPPATAGSPVSSTRSSPRLRRTGDRPTR